VKTETPTESLLLDAGVWAAVFDPADRFHDSARSIVLNVDHPLAALDLTLYELANVLGVKMKLPDKARDITQLVVDRCGSSLLKVDPPALASAVRLAREHDLTAYDAAYVAAAQRYGWQLVSLDIRDLVSKGLAVTPDAADYP
jgi:predicted nucleic acid-binding protein